jgi:alkanesulfonate monooxygenase SsuD/methylene tetrahydromethanopterin reductase-like flavin-dependent oxidoreductase (luciferase family)
MVPGATAALCLEWARKADSGPFSSLGFLDRLVFSNYEALVTLAASAAVTRRIRLMTTILIAPLYPAGILAKQAATIDAFSGGRLTLGLGIGAREDDFLAAPASFHDRGKRFDRQLEQMHRIWSGESLSDQVGPIGPSPAQKGGPEILIGGYTPLAVHRLARWGSGYIAGGGGDPARVLGLYKLAEEAWKEGGRPGKPRLVGAFYCGIGPNAAERATPYIRTYYAFMAPRVESILASLPVTAQAIKDRIKGFADIGMDELILWPCIADLDQVDRLAELVA